MRTAQPVGGRRCRSRIWFSVSLLVLAACATTPATPRPPTPTAASTTATPTAAAAATAGLSPSTPYETAADALRRLPVKGRAPKTGYSRAQFGPTWPLLPGRPCDARNDVLRRDLTAVLIKPDTHGCVVAAGTLHDPYTGDTISFTRGVSTSAAVEVDHVVALGDSWQKGAQSWTAARREQYANDPLVLLAVDGPTNVQKGDADAASWLPPNKAWRCPYVARQVSIKLRYGLWITQAEHAAMLQVLSGCRHQALIGDPDAAPPAAVALKALGHHSSG